MTIHDLCAHFGINRRLVYSYIERDIIPPPYGRGRHAYYGLIHTEALQAYRDLKHNNVSAPEALRYCAEAGITLRQYMLGRERDIRANGLGVG